MEDREDMNAVILVLTHSVFFLPQFLTTSSILKLIWIAIKIGNVSI